MIVHRNLQGNDYKCCTIFFYYLLYLLRHVILVTLGWPVVRPAIPFSRESRPMVRGGSVGTSVEVERRFDSAPGCELRI